MVQRTSSFPRSPNSGLQRQLCRDIQLHAFFRSTDRPTNRPTDQAIHASTLAANPVHPKSGLVRERSSALKIEAFPHGPGINDPDKAYGARLQKLYHSSRQTTYRLHFRATARRLTYQLHSSYRKTTDLQQFLPTCFYQHAATESVQHALFS